MLHGDGEPVEKLEALWKEVAIGLDGRKVAGREKNYDLDDIHALAYIISHSGQIESGYA
jgi:hypothetical protein